MDASPLVDFIHIGDYKTGTSWLQKEIFSSLDNVYYLDQPDRHPDLVSLLNKIISVRDISLNLDELKRKIFDNISKIDDAAGKVKVISREAFSGNYIDGWNSATIAFRLRYIFDDARVIITLRDQVSWLRSIYSQYVKEGGVSNISDFLVDPYLSNGLESRLCYHELLAAYTSNFGRERLNIRLYDELRESEDQYLEEILSFMGGLERSAVESSKETNASLTDIGCFVQCLINRLFRTYVNPGEKFIPFDLLLILLTPKSTLNRIAEKVKIERGLGDCEYENKAWIRYHFNHALAYRARFFAEKITFGKRVEVPEWYVEKISPAIIQSNRILEREYGLPLEKYGWLV